MQKPRFNRKLLGVSIAVMLTTLLACYRFVKSPSPAEAIVLEFDGVFSSSAYPDRPRLLEMLIGQCPRFDKPGYICIEHPDLKDADVLEISHSEFISHICLHSDSLTDRAITLFTQHNGKKVLGYSDSLIDGIAISSELLTDESIKMLSSLDLTSGIRIRSNGITGKSMNSVSGTRMKYINISSALFDHSVACEVDYPDTLQSLQIIGPPPTLQQIQKYLLHMQPRSRLHVVLSEPLPEDFFTADELRRIRPITLDEDSGLFCDCHYVEIVPLPLE